MLAQVLNAQQHMHREDRLAQALGWELDRLRNAITDLNARLNAIGLRIHRNSMGLCIRNNDDRGALALERLTAYKDADDGVDQGTARILYVAYTGALSATDLTIDRMLKIGALVNRKVITVGTGVGSRIRLTDDTAYAFDMSR